MGDINFSKLYFLGLMTLSYIVGELTHFLTNTTSREMARSLHFGEMSCFVNKTFMQEQQKEEGNILLECPESLNETLCAAKEHCYWAYSGMGIQYQVKHLASY